MNDAVRLVPYTEQFLDRSWTWLRDPEIKALTMTPDFERDDQLRFFDSLPQRHDYRIWGVELLGKGLIGAAGLKNIEGASAEYWGYIGEKEYWGRGLGRQMLAAIEDQARALEIDRLRLIVAKENRRAVTLYRHSGYAVDDSAPDAETLTMTKALQG